MKLSPRILRDSFVSFSSIYLGVLLNLFFAFGLQVILARQLSPDHYGMLVSTLTLIALISALANVGIPSFWLRMFGTEHLHAQRWIKVSFKLLIYSICIFISILWIWAYWGPHSTLNAQLFFLLTPILIGQITIDLMTAKLQLEERFSLLGVWQFIQNTLRFISVIVLMLVVNNIEIKTVALSFVISSLIFIGFAIRPLLNLFNGQLALPQHEPPLSSPNPIISAKLKNVFCQSYPFALSGLMYIIYFQSDIILLNYLDSSSAAGIYNIAFTVMAAVYLFPNIFYQKFLLPKLHRWKAHDQEKLNSTYKLGNFLMLGSGLIIMILLWLIVPWAITNVFGLKYHDAILYLNILAVCAPLRFLSSSVASILLSHDEMKRKVSCMALVAITNILLNFLFIPLWGAAGAAITTVISESLLLVLFLLAVNKHRKHGAIHY